MLTKYGKGGSPRFNFSFLYRSQVFFDKMMANTIKRNIFAIWI